MNISVSGGTLDSEIVLGKLSGANLNITTDQIITLLAGNKNITRIDMSNFSSTPSLAAGGFYTATSKGGNAVVAAAQVYTAGAAGVLVLPTVAKPYVTGTSLYFALTTAQGGALTADITVYGRILP